MVHANHELDFAVGDAGQVVGVGPNIKLGGHFLEITLVAAGHIVVPAESVAARIVGEALGLEDGGAGCVLVHAGGHEGLQFVNRILGCQRGLGFVVVAEAAVVVETGIEAGQIDMPRQLHIVRVCPGAIPIVGRLNLPRRDIAAFIAENLLRRDAPVRSGHQRGVAEKLQGKARRFQIRLRIAVAIGRADFRVDQRRLNPFQEIRRAVAHFRENPRAIFNVDQTRMGLGRIDESLRGVLDIAFRRRFIEKLRRRLHPRAVAAAPGVVAVGRRHDNDRAVGVRGKGRDEVVDFADAFVGIAVAIAQHVVGRHQIHLLDGAGVRVDILRLVQLVGVRRDVPGGVAGVGLAVPPAAGGRGAQKVGFVRRG